MSLLNTTYTSNINNVQQADQKSFQYGFSLIELLIAVAIVAILGAIAQPIYSDYVVRAKMSEPLQVADNLSARIIQCMVLDSSIYSECNSFTKLNVNEDDFLTETIESIDFSNDTPSFSIELQNTGNNQLDAATINYSAISLNTQVIRWQCQVSDANLNHLVSKQCRI